MKVVLSLCICFAAAFSPRTAARGPAAKGPLVHQSDRRGRGLGRRPQAQAQATAPRSEPTGGPIPCRGVGVAERKGLARAVVRYRTELLFCALIAQKVAADTLTGYTRARGVAYSGATVSMLSELAKFPVLAAAITVFGGGAKRILPTLRGAVAQSPFTIAWIAAAYAAQNVLYFVALGHISAASYQVLSQSKMIFTAMLAVVMLRERLSLKKVVSLGALLGGSLLVQFSEMGPGASVALGRNAVYGGLVTVLGALLSALPNVWYEKLLKTEGEDEWVRNVQVTTWIFAWIAVSQLLDATRRGGLAAIGTPGKAAAALIGGPAGLKGITPLVWLIIVLKSLNGILIPATLKYAGNLVYLYAKPTSIVLTAAATALYSREIPNPAFAAGAALVIWSMVAFNAKKQQPPQKKAD